MTFSRSVLDPEKVAYWYLRLNGFLQLENFYIHPASSGAARTDADLLGVRFPYRAERFVDDPTDVMADDAKLLGLSDTAIDIVIAEVKRGPCALNGPWSSTVDGNIQRVLSAIGCMPTNRLDEVANDIYEQGLFVDEEAGLRVRLLCIGAAVDEELSNKFPNVAQVSWPQALDFIFQRFRNFAKQKTQTELWDHVGRQLKTMVTSYRRDERAFIRECLSEMSINPRHWPDATHVTMGPVAKAAPASSAAFTAADHRSPTRARPPRSR